MAAYGLLCVIIDRAYCARRVLYERRARAAHQDRLRAQREMAQPGSDPLPQPATSAASAAPEDAVATVATPSEPIPPTPSTDPVFVPLFMRLGVAPQTVLAAYRTGDSPTNVLTPLMPYFPLMVVFAARYQKDSGIGTVIALMLPHVAVMCVAWTLFFVVWFVAGLPWGL